MLVYISSLTGASQALITDIVNILMQRVPKGLDPAEIAAEIGKVLVLAGN